MSDVEVLGNVPIRKVVSVDPNDSARVVEMDTIVKADVSISMGHHEIHEECTFMVGIVDLVMDAGDTIIIGFKSPPGVNRMHLLYDYEALVDGHLDIYKNSTWDAETGTLVPIYNRFQRSTPESSAVLENQSSASFVANDNMILTPTNTSLGDKIMPTDYAFGVKNRFQGKSRSTNEIIIQPDTQHLVIFTAVAINNGGAIYLDWYEHEDE